MISGGTGQRFSRCHVGAARTFSSALLAFRSSADRLPAALARAESNRESLTRTPSLRQLGHLGHSGREVLGCVPFSVRPSVPDPLAPRRWTTALAPEIGGRVEWRGWPVTYRVTYSGVISWRT